MLKKTQNVSLLLFDEEALLPSGEDILALLRKNSFHRYSTPEDEDAPPIYEEKVSGWVGYDDITDVELKDVPVELGEFLIFGLRTDTRKVPPSLLKKELDLAVKKELKETQRPFVPRLKKTELKEQILLRLRAKILPVPKIINAVWDYSKRKLYLFTVSTSDIEDFQKSFGITFNIQPQEWIDDLDVQFDFHDFLKWLWFISENKEGFVQEDRQLSIGSNLHMVDLSNQGVVATKDKQVEARFALAMGLNITKIDVIITSGDGLLHWNCSISELSRLKSLKTPNSFLEVEADKEAIFFERIAMIQEMFDMLFTLHSRCNVEYFIDSRNLEQWVKQGKEANNEYFE